MDKEKSLIKRIPEKYKDLVKECLTFVKAEHKEDFRLNGESYFHHVINVADLVIDTGLDINSVLVALLHHVYFSPKKEVADKKTVIKIEEMFGKEVLELLTFVNKLSNITKMDTERDILTKYILKDCDDLRALIIRLCDKIMNARTIDALPREKQLTYSEKLLRIYAPISEYLNLYHFRKEFETIAFKTLEPEEFDKIDIYLQTQKAYNERVLKELVSSLKKIVENDRSASVFGRVKGHYSIFKKLKKYRKEGKVDDLYTIKDVLAFSILVDTVEDCYLTLSVLQADKNIQIVEVEDYVLDKKPNGYSAIHLTIEVDIPILDDIIETEIQVLTNEMYHLNTYGSASHFAYKQQGLRYAKPSSNFEWVKTLRAKVSLNNKGVEMVLSRPIKSDVFVEQVYVFTPKGDIVDLPNGSTVVDFAFAIHTAIGNRMVGAKVNNQNVGLSTTLKDGDIVEIITSNNPNSRSKVSDTWLELAKTKMAKKKVIKELARKWK